MHCSLRLPTTIAPSFDRVLTWTQANMAKGDLRTNLPAWLWGKDKDGTWKTLDANPPRTPTSGWPTRFWKQAACGSSPLHQRGQSMMAQIAATEVGDLPGFGPMLLPGQSGFVHQTTLTNQAPEPSTQAPAEQGKQNSGKHKNEPLPLPASQSVPHRRFWSIPVICRCLSLSGLPLDPAGPWRQIGANIPRLLGQSARHGFAMDWVDYVPGDGFYPVTEQQPSGIATEGPGGSYDAIRVYLWAGMMAAGGEKRELDARARFPA